VNSENRAKQIRKEIEKRLGARATHESTLAQTLDEMRKNAPPDADEAELHDAEMEAPLADLEARKLPQATLQMQVESWAHQRFLKAPLTDGVGF